MVCRLCFSLCFSSIYDCHMWLLWTYCHIAPSWEMLVGHLHQISTQVTEIQLTNKQLFQSNWFQFAFHGTSNSAQIIFLLPYTSLYFWACLYSMRLCIFVTFSFLISLISLREREKNIDLGQNSLYLVDGWVMLEITTEIILNPLHNLFNQFSARHLVYIFCCRK